MYIPNRYRQTDSATVAHFLQKNYFGHLVSQSPDGYGYITSLPFVAKWSNDELVLWGHLSKGNPQKASIIEGSLATAVFQGAHTYISPKWYTSLNTPTWNYLMLHCRGKLICIEGEELKQHLAELIEQTESQFVQGMTIDDIPTNIFEDDFRGIVGFKLEVHDWQASWKLSQNRDAESHANIVATLQKGDEMMQQIAEEMQKAGCPFGKTK